jgi:predicted PurR-regulated permease PerM
MNEETLQDKSLTVLLGLVSIAFIWILLPFYGAVFWAVILGILFAPLQRRLQLKFGWQRNVTSLLTLSVCLVIAILPVIILGALLVQEGAALYNRIEAASWTLQAMTHFKHSLPPYFQHCSIGSGSAS